MGHTRFVSRFAVLLIAGCAFFAQEAHGQYTVSTVAGGGPNHLPVLNASIGYPGSVAFDSGGNSYIADSYSNHVFKVSAAGTLTVLAGNGTRGYSGDGGPAASAQLAGPEGVFVDGTGNVFIADTENSVIREIPAGSGNIKTVAGNYAAGAGYSGDGGPATSAQLSDPFGLFVDGSGNIFIADADNSVIREVVSASGNIQTVAGNFAAGPGYSGDGNAATSAQLDLPEGVFVDGAGNIFIADSDNNAIRKVTAGTGVMQTVAGSFYNSQGGTACATFNNAPTSAATAQFCTPAGIAVDGSGNIFIADTNNSAIWEVSGAAITLLAGTGTAGFSGDGGAATSAQVNYPSGIAVDGSGDVFIADTGNYVIREVNGSNISTTAGNLTLAYSGDGGPALNAELNYPGNVAVDSAGNIFIADSVSSAIREVIAASGNIQTVAGTGAACSDSTTACGDNATATSAQLNNPYGIALDSSNNVYIADTANHRIRVVNAGTDSITIAGVAIAGGDIATVAGNGTPGYSGDNGAATSAELFSPSGIFVDGSGNIFVADTNNHVVREIVPSTGIISTVAGNGTQCSQSTGTCGDGGAATSAELSIPTGVAVDGAGNIYVADFGSNRIRAVNPGASAATIASVSVGAGNIATIAGTGVGGYSGDDGAATSAQLAGPMNVFLDSSANVFIADAENFVMREVVASSGLIATVAGSNVQGFTGDGGTSLSATFNFASGVVGDDAGNLYVADTDNSRIRKLTPSTGAPSAAQPAAQTTTPGGAVTYAIELRANTGNPKYPITLSCLQSSLPSGASCAFSPAKITPQPVPVPFTMTVSVPASSATLHGTGGSRLYLAMWLFPIAGLAFGRFSGTKGPRRLVGVASLTLLLLLFAGCGSGGSGNGGGSGGGGTTYHIQVHGTTAAQTNPVTITTATLTVQ